jgi:hypothetical protein
LKLVQAMSMMSLDLVGGLGGSLVCKLLSYFYRQRPTL